MTNRLKFGDRKTLPRRRTGFTKEVTLGGYLVYLRTDEYVDGTLGGIMIDVPKAGESFRAALNCFALAVSLGLQHGVPLKTLVREFTYMRFEPAGVVDGDEDIQNATSVIDYVVRSLEKEYSGGSEGEPDTSEHLRVVTSEKDI